MSSSKTATDAPVTRLCDACGDDRDFVRSTLRKSAKIRGVEVTADLPYLVCPKCGQEYPDLLDGRDPMARLFDAYRAERGLLTSAEIRGIRESWGLSHEAFAAILGVSASTLYRYEKGALQDDAHDALLRLSDHQGAFSDLVQHRRDRITSEQYNGFREAFLGRQAARFKSQAPTKADPQAGQSPNLGGRRLGKGGRPSDA